MGPKNKTKKDNKDKRKVRVKFRNRSGESFLILITLLLAILLVVELVQIFLQFRGLTRKNDNNQPIIVDSQPVDIWMADQGEAKKFGI